MAWERISFSTRKFSFLLLPVGAWMRILQGSPPPRKEHLFLQRKSLTPTTAAPPVEKYHSLPPRKRRTSAASRVAHFFAEDQDEVSCWVGKTLLLSSVFLCSKLTFDLRDQTERFFVRRCASSKPSIRLPYIFDRVVTEEMSSAIIFHLIFCILLLLFFFFSSSLCICTHIKFSAGVWQYCKELCIAQ